MMIDNQYPAMATYAVNDFFTTKYDMEKVVNEIWTIKEHCSLICFYRGDLTGQVHGMSYVGLEEAGKLLAEFERKAAEYKEARANLKKELPAPDYDFLVRDYDSIDHHRKCITEWYEEIQQYFNLTHKHYNHYPAPKREKVSGLQNLIVLAAYASLAFTMYHWIFN